LKAIGRWAILPLLGANDERPLVSVIYFFPSREA